MSVHTTPFIANNKDLTFYCKNYLCQDVEVQNDFRIKGMPKNRMEICCVGRLVNEENFGQKCVVVLENLKPCLYLRLPGYVSNLEPLFHLISQFNRKFARKYEFINPFDLYNNNGEKIDVTEEYRLSVQNNYLIEGSLFDGFRPCPEFFLKLEFHSEGAKKEVARNLMALEDQKFDFTEYVSDFLHYSEESFLFYHQAEYEEYENGNQPFFKTKVELCDVQLDAILQLYHEQNMLASNFQTIPQGKYMQINSTKFNIPHFFKSDYQHIHTVDPDISATWKVPINIMSFDGEMNSHHGEFPNPSKDYFKFCKELIAKMTLWKKNPVTERKLIPVKDYVLHAFNIQPIEALKKEIGVVFTKNAVVPSENSINTFCNFAEQKFLEVWNEINSLEMQVLEKKQKKDDVKKLVKQLKKNLVKRLIQVTELVDPTNGRVLFPSVLGDEVIQIGIVFNWFRGEEYYRKIILSLKGCTDIPGTEVYCFQNEKDLLLKFRDVILEEFPDVLVGYNIFTFDWNFIYQRAEQLDIVDEFSQFGIFRNKPCELRKLKLNSAGLGDNFLTFPNMPGTTQIDMLGVARQSAKLEAYDLSTVSSNYIYGKILYAMAWTDHQILLCTNTVYALHVEDFILINYFEIKKTGILNGKKFVIKQIIKHGEEMPAAERLESSLGKDYSKHNYLVIELFHNEEQMMAQDILDSYNSFEKMEWGLAKDDVTPQNIFDFFKKDDYSRGIIAKYCVKDCLLVTNLVDKLDVVMNNIAMSNVCSVPFQDIFIRGQGRKFFSLTSKECRYNQGKRYFIPHKKKPSMNGNDDDDEESVLSELELDFSRGAADDGGEYEEDAAAEEEVEIEEEVAVAEANHNKNNFTAFKIVNNVTATQKEKKELIETETEGYEGAIVLQPKPDLYVVPIVTLDFGSLYPSSMIDRNLSHDTYVSDDRYKGEIGKQRLLEEFGVTCVDIDYDNYTFIKKGKSKKRFVNKENPVITCRFIQPLIDENGQTIDETRGLIPRILQKILKERKKAKKRKSQETDPFRIQLMESTQLAYKLTANSGYGTIGATVSELYFKEVAACTTAVGRSMLEFAQKYVLEHYQGAEIVYGDTDSVFVKFDFGHSTTKEELLKTAFELGFEVESGIQPLLRHPHVLEFEKIYFPYYLFSKKKYAGYKYDSDVYTKFEKDMSLVVHKYKKDFNGISPKRRDSCILAKNIYLDILWTLFETNDILQAYNLLQSRLKKLINNEYPMDMLVLTKTLKSTYENPDQVGHKVLADRLEEQGHFKYMPNDRIPFVFVDIGAQEKSMISDMMEHPEIALRNNLKPDYIYYIDNQLGNNIAQLFYLIVQKLPKYNLPSNYFEIRHRLLREKYPGDDKKVFDTLKKEKMEVTKQIIFQDILTPLITKRQELIRAEHNKQNNQTEITHFSNTRNTTTTTTTTTNKRHVAEEGSNIKIITKSKSGIVESINGVKNIHKKTDISKNTAITKFMNSNNTNKSFNKNSILFK